jgi:hypothetical protein
MKVGCGDDCIKTRVSFTRTMLTRTIAEIYYLGFTVLDHPPYSPDFAPSLPETEGTSERT